MKNIYYLYEIGINIPKYIGLTKQSLKNRLASHRISKGNTKREQWIKSAILGGGLGINLIETVEDNISLEREEFWTNQYSGLVNLRIGNKASNELKQIFSKAQKNKPINWDALRKTHASNRGRKRSQEFKDKVSKGKLGIPRNPVSAAKMKKHHTENYGIKILIDGVLFHSIREAHRITGISRTTIKGAIRGLVKNQRKHNIEIIQNSQLIAGT